jgi:autotransporter-associated beta strand protein
LSSLNPRRRNIVTKFTLSALVVVASVLFLARRCPAQTDLQTITQREQAELIDQDPSDSTVEGFMSSLQSNGSWSDIDYQNTAETNWTPATHLTRMDSMAESYQNPSSSLYHSSTLMADISNAFNYWVSVDPTSTNWYDNDIRTPEDMGQCVMLISSQLSSTQLSEDDTILNQARATLNNPSYAQGSNLVLLSEVGVYQGVIDANTSYLSEGFQGVFSTIYLDTALAGDGFQPDGTYHFHGNQLYEGDYGVTAIQNPLNDASISVGTAYAATTTQEEVLINDLIEGSQWFVYGQSLAFSASGRDPTNEGFNSVGVNYISAIESALELGSYDQSQLQAFLTRQEDAASSGSASSSTQLTGNRGFYDSDFMVEQQPKFFADVKVTSTRTINPESINGQDLEGLYLGDGVNEIMVTGNEFNNIEPVWNWRRLPGTTVEQNTRSLQPGYADSGNTNYAGGVSDGNYGAEALEYNRFNVAADKSWFFFQNEEVALGAAINASKSTSQVDTTLNQCLLTSTVTYDTSGGSQQTLTTGTVTPANLSWVYQGGVGYFFPTPVSNATVQAISQSGNWDNITTEYGSIPESANVFTLYINHGTGFTGGSYDYIVVPNTTASGMATYVASDPISVLSNTSTVQAVTQNNLGITQAAFYSSGSFNLSTGQTISANNSSMVMIERQTNDMELDAASPQNLQMALQVQLSGVTLSGSTPTWLNSMGTATATFNLPGGNSAGSTIGLTLSSTSGSTPTVSLSNSVGSGTISYNVTSPVALPGNTTFTTDANSSLTFSAAISGSASLSTAGAVTLSAANTYNGGTNVLGGTLVINSGSNLGSTSAALSLGTPVPATGGATTPTGNLILNNNATIGSFSSTSSNSTADVLTIVQGAKLTDTGAFTVGGINNNTNGTIYNGALAVTGGGSLVVTGAGAFTVGQTSNNTGGKDTTTVNLSGLSSFNVGTTGEFGVGNGVNSAGILTLADNTLNGTGTPTNIINAAEIDIGNSQFNNDGGLSYLNLGSGSNYLESNTINIGIGKTGGIVDWVSDATSSSSINILGSNGFGAANITLSQANAATYTLGRTAQLLLAGHPATVQAGTLLIGDATGNFLNGPNATVTFDTGAFSAQSVTLAADTGGTSSTGPIGTLTIGGSAPNNTATGVFTVGSATTPGTFQLGDFTNTGLSATAVPTFTINSGVVDMYSNITVASTAGTTTSTLTLAGNGVLNMEGNSIAGAGSGTSGNGPITTVQLAPNVTDTPTLENLGGAGINGAGLNMNGLGTLILSGANTYTGGTTVSSGTLIAASVLPTGPLTIATGAAAHLASSIGTTTLTSLAINGGNLDIANNAIVTGDATTSEATIQQYIESGAITSTFVTANPGYGIAYADGGDSGLNDPNLTTGHIVIEPDLVGDTDLDGMVNVHDIQDLLTDFNQPGCWDQGNFLGHATVDISNLQALLSNFNDSTSLSDSEMSGIENIVGQFGDLAIPNANGTGFTLVAVPEPATASLALVGAAWPLLARRRRTI